MVDYIVRRRESGAEDSTIMGELLNPVGPDNPCYSTTGVITCDRAFLERQFVAAPKFSRMGLLDRLRRKPLLVAAVVGGAWLLLRRR